MAIEGIGAVLDNNVTSQRAGLGQEDFLRVLLTQFTSQDPLKPLDNQQFIAQLAQFTNLEQTRQVNDRIESLLTLQAANQAVGLLGHVVEVATDTGEVVGNVTTLTFQQGVPQLTVQTDSGEFLTNVGLSQISIVR